MKKFLAPNGEYIPIPEGRITTIGLNAKQNTVVKNAFPTPDYLLLDTDEPTDLIAIYATVQIIKAAALDNAELEMVFEFYTEVIENVDRTIFWLGDPKGNLYNSLWYTTIGL